MNEVACVIPTRGLVFTECIRMVLMNFAFLEQEIQIALSSDLPIPDAHNKLVKRTLEKTDANLIWMVEADHAPDPLTLAVMMEANDDIVTVHYALDHPGYDDAVFCFADGSIAWGGLGCTLIKRKVFEKMKYPYFRADTDYLIERDDNGKIAILTKNPIKTAQPGKKYGTHDVDFYRTALEFGFSVTVLDLWCRHLKVVKYGEQRTNKGCHLIKEKGVGLNGS